MQTSLFPATGWRSPAPPPQRGAVEWAEEESEGGRTREAPHTRYTAPQPAAAPYGTGERPETAGWDGSRSGSTGGWAEPESGRVQLAAYQPIAGKQPAAGKQPLAKPAPTGPRLPTSASPAQSGTVGSGRAKPSGSPALSAEERAQLQALDREIAEVEALSVWHHDQIRANRAQKQPIPDSDSRTQQHLQEIQQVLNPKVLALKQKRTKLLADSTSPVSTPVPPAEPESSSPHPYTLPGKIFQVEQQVLSPEEQQALRDQRSGWKGKTPSLVQRRLAARAEEKVRAALGAPFSALELQRRRLFGPGTINPRTLQEANSPQGWERVGSTANELLLPNGSQREAQSYEHYRNLAAQGLVAAPPRFSDNPKQRAAQEADLKRIRAWLEENLPPILANAAEVDLRKDPNHPWAAGKRRYLARFAFLESPQGAEALGMKTEFGRQLLRAVAAERRVRMPWRRREARATGMDLTVNGLALGAGLATGGLSEAYLAGPGLVLARTLGPAAKYVPPVLDGMVSGAVQQAGTAYAGGERDPEALAREAGGGALGGAVLGFLGGLLPANKLTRVQRNLARANLEEELGQLAWRLENTVLKKRERSTLLRQVAQLQKKLGELGGPMNRPLGPRPPIRGKQVGGLGIIKPQGVLEPRSLDDWLRVARSPEFERDIQKYNNRTRPFHNLFLGQVKSSKSAAEVIKALESGRVEVRKISSNANAAVFKMRDLETGKTYYHLQGNALKDPTGEAMRHELLHLGAMLNGQQERGWLGFALDIPHEMAVSWATTPKNAMWKATGLTVAGGVIGGGGAVVKEVSDQNRQTAEQERNALPPLRRSLWVQPASPPVRR